MQHPRARRLRQQARQERHDGAAARAGAGDEADAGRLDAAGQQAREDGLGAGVDGAEQEAAQRDEDGVGDEVGDEPDEHVEDEGAEGQREDGALLAEAVAEGREGEAAEGDAALWGVSLLVREKGRGKGGEVTKKPAVT